MKSHHGIAPISVVASILALSLMIQFGRWIYPVVSFAGSNARNEHAIDALVAGDYSGQATLQGVYNGTLDNTTAVSNTMDLGYIDLAFNLNQAADGKVTGNVVLSRTLVFSATEENIAIAGNVNGGNLQLQSGKFTMKMNEARMVNGEQIAPERVVTRRFSLDTDQIINDGATLLGTYRETIWGYGPEPVTVVGRFSLERALFGSTGTGVGRPSRINLPFVSR